MLIESIRSQEKISEYPELSTGGKNVSTEDPNVSTVSQNVSTVSQNVSTEDQNVSTVSQNVSAGSQNQHPNPEVSRDLSSLVIKYRNRVIFKGFCYI